jgi:hypothetical protein
MQHHVQVRPDRVKIALYGGGTDNSGVGRDQCRLFA